MNRLTKPLQIRRLELSDAVSWDANLETTAPVQG